ncbi:SDR family oxidoreductase [Aquisalimonas sp. 2447]|uniref:UDP-glucose 4-epimerase family protein n=1 Tax=Aquisalimonas sp. 2447 TaxID=2740807 RepID=UPI001432768E|nr:SDR family oxidoreductase [Aquisalimonas sp. 2447]QIT55910.1 SDR family oxidoreductase [Aquisalimonas sp. 2447]
MTNRSFRGSEVLVTGCNGFVGDALVSGLAESGYSVRGAVRRHNGRGGSFEQVAVGEVGGATDWQRAVAGVEAIIHLVARTHATGERGGGDLADYRPINVDGTRRLAEEAARAGVRRLVFVSSVKVNGERTTSEPFKASDTPAPEDAYGISKREAEQALAEVSARTGLEVVIVRPPLVYGPGVKGNFARLVKLVERGLPLPLGAVDNRRSLVALPNLVDLLVRCVEAPNAAGQTFLVSDGEDVSTPRLIRMLGEASGRRAPLVPVPTALLRLAGRLTGRSEQVDRLCGSLQVDISATREALGWTPPVQIKDALRDTVAGDSESSFSSSKA